MQLLVAASLPSAAFAFPPLLLGYGDAPLLSFCVQLPSSFIFWPLPPMPVSQLLERPWPTPEPQLLPGPALLLQRVPTRSFLHFVAPQPLPSHQHQALTGHAEQSRYLKLLL